MNQSVHAIFEDGVFKPLSPVSLEIKEGERVQIKIMAEDVKEEELTLNQRYFRGLSEKYLDNVITHALEDSDAK